MTYSKTAPVLDKTLLFSYRISFYVLLHHQFDPFGNSPMAQQFDHVLEPSENIIKSKSKYAWNIDLILLENLGWDRSLVSLIQLYYSNNQVINTTYYLLYY